MSDQDVRQGTNHFPRAAQSAAMAIEIVLKRYPEAQANCPSGWLAQTILEATRQTAAGKAISSAAITASAEGCYAIDKWNRERPTGTAIHP